MLVFLLTCIEIPLLLVAVVVTKIVKAFKQSRSVKGAAPERRRSMELSVKQKEKIVKAILEDALLENDSAYDSLMYEGEASYPAENAARITSEEFDLQYGSKTWIDTWARSLALWFDCQSEYTNNGVFRLYGKEA